MTALDLRLPNCRCTLLACRPTMQIWRRFGDDPERPNANDGFMEMTNPIPPANAVAAAARSLPRAAQDSAPGSLVAYL
jgi:hypothetical protein